MSAANERQVGGVHYKTKIQHWDFAASNNLDYFQGQITKYVARWKNKNGVQDLEKAAHFLQKYIEVVRAQAEERDQDVQDADLRLARAREGG